MWLAIGLVWLIGAFTAKRVARRQTSASRLAQFLLGLVAYFIGFARPFAFPPLTDFISPGGATAGYAGVAIASLGIAYAIWARIQLGGNWSGTVTVKENHTLMTGGPYAFTRHPIYSGMLLGMIGTAITYRELRVWIALLLVFVMFSSKIHTEEQFMTEQFGQQYADYRRKVRALIPYVY